MEKDYDYALILGSFMMAFLTSFLAIAYASFIIWHKRYNSKIWTSGAAFNMGMGIWTMHFIGMLAMHIETPIAFDIFKTILSAFIAVTGAYLTFIVLLKPQQKNPKHHQLLAAFILGSSVLSMHYLGMDAMQMFPPIQYNAMLVIASMIIAYGASYIGLEIFIRSAAREQHNVFILNNLIASIIIGFAIAAMHYTGMAAANFVAGSYCTVQQGIDTGPLAAYVVGIVTLILVTSFMFIIYEQGKDTKRAQKALEEMNANLTYLVDERTKNVEQAMEELKSTQNQLVEQEKMASLGGLVAGVAHEVNTPLGVGLTSSSLLKENVQQLKNQVESKTLTQKDLTEFLDNAIETSTILEDNLHKAAELIASFKQLAVDQSSHQIYTFNISDSIKSALDSLNHKLKHQNIQTELICDDEITTYNNSGAFSQVVTNMIMNASIHAFDDTVAHPKLTVRVEDTGKDDLIISFNDNGVGMPDTVLKQIFEPFFTTKRGSGGSGLGMHVVYNLANKHLNGGITVESEPGKGSTFILTIPKQNSDPDAALFT